jgi:protease IV
MFQSNRRPLLATVAVCLVSSVAWGQMPTGQNKKLAHFHLGGAITEVPQEDPFGFTSGQMTSLKELQSRFAKARKDPDVQALVITMSGVSMGLGQLEEIREEIAKFKAVDKRVFVHVDSLNTGLYALVSAASDLSIVPTADVWLTGMYTEGLYLKNMLDKIGCRADIIHIGDFKSAGETLTRTGPSEAASANLEWLLDGIYGNLIKMMADSRGLTAKRMEQIVDNGPYTAEKALDLGLVDSVQYRDQFLSQIKNIYGDDVEIDNRYAEKSGVDIDMSNPFAFFKVFGEMFGGGKSKARKDSIGIVYVEGAIVTGYAQPSPFGGSSGAFSGDIERALQMAADDDTIKAVVLRVDSPGGSALASEIIWRATQKVRAKKPFIVSMGNVAASGGYYVACGSDAIFADATTITGSIGVVGGKIITADMWSKLGVNWVPHKKGANADLMNSLEPFNEQQRDHVENWMLEIYDVFKSHVQADRGSKLSKPLQELAGGRVFTGRQALDNGLVDKIGGLDAAVDFAARRASIGDYDVRVVPEPKNFIDKLIGEMSGKGERPSDITVHMKPNLLARPENSLWSVLMPLVQHLEPQRAAALTQAMTRIALLRKETVITMMPMEIIIR